MQARPFSSAAAAIVRRLLPFLLLTLGCLLAAPAAAQRGNTDALNFAQGVGRYAFTVPASNGADLRAMAVQPDGRIVLAGGCHNGTDADFCIARLTRDGVLDGSFVGPAGNAGGRFLLPVGSGNDGAVAVAVQRDGRILVAGACAVAGVNSFCLVRLLADGSLDVSFNGPDAAGTGTGNGQGRVLLRIGSGNETLSGLALQADGKIVVVGTCRPATINLFCVVRLNTDGSFDASFDGPDAAGSGTGSGNGRFALAVGTGGNAAAAVALQADGKIVVAGTCDAGPSGQDFCLIRLLGSDGRFDSAFDGGDNSGPFTGNGRVIVAVSPGSGADYAVALAIRADRSIIVAGSCSNGSNFDFCAFKLEGVQGRSSNFWASGFPGLQLPVGTGDDFVTGLVLQADGSFVLTGQCQNGSVYQFCAARYLADGALDVTFDGDGGSGNGRFLLPAILSDDRAAAAAGQLFASVSGDEQRLLLAGSCRLGTVQYLCITRLWLGPMATRTCQFDVDGDGRLLATVDGLIMTRVMLGLRGAAVVAGINFAADAGRRTWSDIQQYLSNQCGMVLEPDLASQ